MNGLGSKFIVIIIVIPNHFGVRYIQIATCSIDADIVGVGERHLF